MGCGATRVIENKQDGLSNKKEIDMNKNKEEELLKNDGGEDKKSIAKYTPDKIAEEATVEIRDTIEKMETLKKDTIEKKEVLDNEKEKDGQDDEGHKKQEYDNNRNDAGLVDSQDVVNHVAVVHDAGVEDSPVVEDDTGVVHDAADNE